MDDKAKIVRAMTWAQKRLEDCVRTESESPHQRSRDWAYGESVALRAMLHILNGGEIPE